VQNEPLILSLLGHTQGPPVRFASDGSGRDGFQGDRGAPYTGKQFDPFNSPSTTLPPKPSKGFHYAKGVRAGYLPNGTGRDLQLFIDDGGAAPATGYQFSAKPPSSKRFQQPTPACRTDPPAKTKPNGSGRDLFQIATGSSGRIPATSVVFSEVLSFILFALSTSFRIRALAITTCAPVRWLLHQRAARLLLPQLPLLATCPPEVAVTDFTEWRSMERPTTLLMRLALAHRDGTRQSTSVPRPPL
jgi:hypothetical protein